MTTKRHTLSVEPRTILGKQVKQLRLKGIIPGNIYGHKVDSTPVSIDERLFSQVYKQAGETGLINISIDAESKPRPVLVHSMLRHPVTDNILHVDFYQVNLKEKLVASVPLEFVGESPLVKSNEALLLETLQEIEVECLPTDIPSSIQVDVSNLTEVNQGITVAELPIPEGVDVKTEGEEMVCKLASPRIQETEEELAEEAEAAEAAEEAAEASAEEATE